MVGNGGVQTTWNDVHDEQSHEIWHMRIYIYIYMLYTNIYIKVKVLAAANQAFHINMKHSKVFNNIG